MSLIEQELFEGFKFMVLEALVPLSVQRRMAGVRDIWKELTDSKDGKSKIERMFFEYSDKPAAIYDTIMAAIAEGDENIRFFKEELYKRISKESHFFEQFFGRRMTNGNEQCPYWDAFSYRYAPQEILSSKDN